MIEELRQKLRNERQRADRQEADRLFQERKEKELVCETQLHPPADSEEAERNGYGRSRYQLCRR